MNCMSCLQLLHAGIAIHTRYSCTRGLHGCLILCMSCLQLLHEGRATHTLVMNRGPVRLLDNLHDVLAAAAQGHSHTRFTHEQGGCIAA